MATDVPVAPLAAAVARLVATCPSSSIEEIASKLRGLETAGGFGDLFAPVAQAWKSEPSVNRACLALAFEAALEARQAALRPLEIVWTGPSTDGARTLNTTATLFEIVDRAKRRLLLMSFSAFPIAGFVDALLAASMRGVAIRLVLESVVESGGKLSIDASHPFERLRGVADFYVWPHAVRPPGASMHAKAAVADGLAALVTSANLTQFGIDANIELGTYFEDRSVASQIEVSIDGLIACQILVRVP